jgi:hypothetical protein
MREPITEICRALGKIRTSVSAVLRLHRGFAPPLRKRSANAVTLAEREGISRGLSTGHTLRQIARTLQRSPSTISREVDRNGGIQGYRAAQADQLLILRRSWRDFGSTTTRTVYIPHLQTPLPRRCPGKA